MNIESLETILKKHPFLADMPADHLHALVSCARNEVFHDGDHLCREGGEADTFYLIREGQVALEIHAPERGGIRLDTLESDDILGWSWIVAPYLWRFDARAVGQVRAIALDGRCLRGKCEDDHHLGYQLLKRFAPLIEQRLMSARMQLIDVYGGSKA